MWIVYLETNWKDILKCIPLASITLLFNEINKYEIFISLWIYRFCVENNAVTERYNTHLTFIISPEFWLPGWQQRRDSAANS